MNFFKEQQIARERLIRFRRLFFITVFLTAYGTAFVFDAFLTLKLDPESFSFTSHFDQTYFWFVLTGVLFFILGMSWFKRRQMGSGGVYIASQAGGKQIPIESKDIRHIRLKNVVEEMSIASGIIPPKIFILENESDINAFAAGFTVNDAVIAVSAGCLDKLTRDELQGVIAHEIGHIVNGDMRLNLELIGYLFGLSGIADLGQILLRARSNSSKRNSGGHIAGLFIYLIGIVGYFLGLVLKQAISRGQEFAADAKAVQLTRNPDGIGGALKKIFVRENAFSVSSNKGHEFSHLWFHWPKSFVFASHPPLEERLAKILPAFDVSTFVLKEKKNLKMKVESDLSDEITKSFGANRSDKSNHSDIPKSFEKLDTASMTKKSIEESAYNFFEAISSHSRSSSNMDSSFIHKMDILLGQLRSLDQESIFRIMNRFKDIIYADKNIIPREILCFILFKESLVLRKKMPPSGLGLNRVKNEMIIMFSFLAQISSEDLELKKKNFDLGMKLVYGNEIAAMPLKFKTSDLIKSLDVCQNLVPLAKEKLIKASISIIDQQEGVSFNREVFKKVLTQMMGIPVNAINS
jgi:Zn-dependent protease with chaperone function